MTFGIQPSEIENLSLYEMEIYVRLIPLYHEFTQTSMENAIKKSLSEVMG